MCRLRAHLNGLAVGISLAAGSTGAACADPLPVPGMTGPLTANGSPTSFQAGPLGTVYVTGAVSGIGLWQDSVAPGDKDAQADMGNGQVFLTKTDGPIQFFAQVGGYSLPALGTTYLRSGTVTDEFYGVLPQAFVKFAPNANLSIIAGKLPTLFGAEYTWSFENMNIERGLLWNQENAVNRGVQVNYASGPLVFAVSWNDGFYSDKYNWASGSVSYTIDSANTITAIAGGNTGNTAKSTLATPLLQNNQDIYDLIFTHTSGPWTLTGYAQYTRVPANETTGISEATSTLGGAVLAKYSFSPKFSVTGRGEYIDSSGSVADGSGSLIYGPGSCAWSITVTPTYQAGIFFARAEVSYVKAGDTTPGFAFGPTFTDTSQTRGMLEIGVLF